MKERGKRRLAGSAADAVDLARRIRQQLIFGQTAESQGGKVPHWQQCGLVRPGAI